MSKLSASLTKIFLAFAVLFHGQLFANAVILQTETRVYIETMEELIAEGDRVTQGC